MPDEALTEHPRKVFVVHGRNRLARDGMFTFLRALGLEPIEFGVAATLTGKGSPYVGEILDAAFDHAQAVVVLMTPDDIAYLRTELQDPSDSQAERQPTGQARPNVFFEAGMAMGRDAARTVLVECGELRPFSDVGGRHVIRLNNSTQCRQNLADRLGVAGCSVNLSGTDWHTAGNLEPSNLNGPLPVGQRLSAAPDQKDRVRLDAQFLDDGRGQGKVALINRGPVDVRNVTIEVPPDVQGLQIHTDGLPVPLLPSGKSFRMHAMRFGDSPSHLMITIKAETEDGEPIEQRAFLDFG